MPKSKVKTALAHTMLTIVFELPSDSTARYTDLGADFYLPRSTPAAPTISSASSKPSVTRSLSPSPVKWPEPYRSTPDPDRGHWPGVAAAYPDEVMVFRFGQKLDGNQALDP
jgi:hypothetical protein